MPKKVPSEYTSRFSVKPKKSSSRTKDDASGSPSREKEPTTVPENLRDELLTFEERKRKLRSNEEVGGEGTASSHTRFEAKELDSYSQQLEVQPPTKKRRFQITKQKKSQGQQAFMTGESRQDESHARQQTQKLDSETFLGPTGPHHYKEEASAIFRNGWQGQDHSQSGIERTAQALADRAANVSDPETLLFLRLVVRAMLEYGSEQSQALDYMLQVYSEALRLLPASITDKDGNGSESTITQLKWLLLEGFHGFDGFLLPRSPATIDLDDHSNLKLRYASVNADLGGVLAQIRDWKRQRKLWLIAAANQSRCFSLDILRKDLGQQIEGLIDAGLNRKQDKWSKVDMLGACILLRGCAKSLMANCPTSRAKISIWKESLENFLLQSEGSRDNDFVIKAHAALALSNLIDGPFDETSEQLFTSDSWIF